ncbi:PhoH family protein [Mycoplasmatota bacterium]|nr:PhoH family protein [Mycoplasmatota bacterium]
MNLTKLNVNFANFNEAQLIIGNNDKNIKTFERFFAVDILTRGDEIFVDTTDENIINQITEVLKALKLIISKDISINLRDITYLCNMVKENDLDKAIEVYSKRYQIVRTHMGKTLYSKSIQQNRYLDAINNSDLVFGIGPAGTGKTYVAVINAIAKLKKNGISKIILTRPAVEAGESLGFLPGDLKEKVDPYLQPLYDALHDVLGKENVELLIEKGVIEIAPLAYMRGRTLDNAYIILDEAQNTTGKQMKMFLTRLGLNSKMIITGDVTQIDLPGNEKSGLIIASKLLESVNGIEVVHFSKVDVIRHPLVQEILRKYEKYENN